MNIIHGNPNFKHLKDAVCPRGIAGKDLVEDSEITKIPLIRKGPRGEDKWEEVSW